MVNWWFLLFLVWQQNDPVANQRFYIEPNSNAAKQAEQWRSARPADAALMDIIAATPQCAWFGNWNVNIANDIDRYVTAAESQNSLPCLVLYNIPFKDCGSYSADGPQQDTNYRTWITSAALGIGSRKALVIYEPDAVAGWDCLSAANGQLQARKDLLRYGIGALKVITHAVVYADGGHSQWHSPEEMAARLTEIGIQQADGFAVNVSNFRTLAELLPYAEKAAVLLGGKHYVMDTSRNGTDPVPDGRIYNPPWAALGTNPSANIGIFFPRWDACLWVKRIGELDAPLAGCGNTGDWCAEYALQLAKNR